MTDTYSTDTPPAAPESAPTYDGGTDGVREAAGEVFRKRREQATAPTLEEPDQAVQAGEEVTELKYTDGRAKDATVTQREAAKDLADYRAAQRQQALLQAEIDALPEVADEQPEQPEAAQPTADPQDRARRAVEAIERLEPEHQQALRETLQNEVQGLEAAKQQYAQGLAALYQQHQASALGEFADIFAAPNPAAALAEMRAQNPERAQRFEQQKRIEQAYLQEQQRIQHANAQQRQQQFTEWSAQQDAAVQSLVPELAAAEPQRVAFQKASVEALEARGFTKAELYAAWQGQPVTHARRARPGCHRRRHTLAQRTSIIEKHRHARQASSSGSTPGCEPAEWPCCRQS